MKGGSFVWSTLRSLIELNLGSADSETLVLVKVKFQKGYRPGQVDYSAEV